ncbi:MAG: HNH endonuclease [bacterium]
MWNQNRVLVLNSSYEAINICSARRAILMLLAEKADIVEESRDYIHSSVFVMPMPEVIRLRRFINLPYRPIPFCRKNIMLRDSYRCQYCGRHYPADELTLDHVLPVSRGGKDSWSNVVTACRQCNNRKGNFLPDEAGMELQNQPKKPLLPTYLHLVRLMGENREVWRKYLFYDEETKEAAV